MLSDRLSIILEAAIRDFIETGYPVSSEAMFKNHKLGVKPATIRNELHELTKLGFLEQPHTSGGRVPTNRGYEFFVELTFDNRVSRAEERVIEYLEAELEKDRIRNFIVDFAAKLGLLGVGYEPADEQVYKSGLPQLVAEVARQNPEEVVEVVNDFERLDSHLKAFHAEIQEREPMVFIGESPITKSRELAVIADNYLIDGKELMLVAVGPKRMDYERNIGIFRKLHQALED